MVPTFCVFSSRYHSVPVQATDGKDVGPENFVIGSEDSPSLVATQAALQMDPTLIGEYRRVYSGVSGS